MGVTIHYRGRLADLARIEDFEDRVIDVALALGGQVRIWRSADEKRPDRIIRGLIATIEPGHEPFSLLVGPEGELLSLVDIQRAERGPLAELPYVSTKTQFGTPAGHVAIVEILRAVQREFIPDLQVHDEGGYWETRDLGGLVGKLGFLHRAMDAMEQGLNEHPLTAEAAEDVDILVTRIGRIAAQVQRTLGRPAEHPPAGPPSPDNPFAQPPKWTEADWDAAFRADRRRQERMERRVKEGLAHGETHEEAFEAALREVVGSLPDRDEGDDMFAVDALAFDADDDPGLGDSSPDDEADDPAEDTAELHPLQCRARSLLTTLGQLFRDQRTHDGTLSKRDLRIDSLMEGACHLNGGLVQALSGDLDDDDLAEINAGLAAVQFKRALRGVAFVEGGLRSLAHVGEIPAKVAKPLIDEAEAIAGEIVERLRTARRRLG